MSACCIVAMRELIGAAAFEPCSSGVCYHKGGYPGQGPADPAWKNWAGSLRETDQVCTHKH